MYTTDSLGYWHNLGVVNAPVLTWVKFPEQATWGNKTFRISFEGDPSKVFNFAWVRQLFPTSAVSLSLRYYPSIEPKLIELEIPQELFDRGVTQRSIEIKQAYKYKRRLGFINYELFKIKVEELAGR